VAGRGLGLDVSPWLLPLLWACPMCAQAGSSRVAVLLPVMFAVPYLVSAVILRIVRRLE
jgi:hypothetical protein